MTVRRLESLADEMNGVVTYDLGDGRYVALDRRAVQKYGANELLRQYGVKQSTERLPVQQRGRVIGTLPADFDPAFIKSTTFLYDPRPGDFRRTEAGWKAADSMGPGDFDAIPQFSRA